MKKNTDLFCILRTYSYLCSRNEEEIENEKCIRQDIKLVFYKELAAVLVHLPD